MTTPDEATQILQSEQHQINGRQRRVKDIVVDPDDLPERSDFKLSQIEQDFFSASIPPIDGKSPDTEGDDSTYPRAEDQKALVEIEEQTTAVAEIDPEKDVDDELERLELEDFKLVRKNLLKMTEKGGKAFESLANLAAYSDHPRLFEALSALMGTLSTTNSDLLELYKKRQESRKRKAELKAPAAGAAGGAPQAQLPGMMTVNTDQAVFLGSTADLNKLLRAREDDEHVINGQQDEGGREPFSG